MVWLSTSGFRRLAFDVWLSTSGFRRLAFDVWLSTKKLLLDRIEPMTHRTEGSQVSVHGSQIVLPRQQKP
jgi:hypothetical protein